MAFSNDIRVDAIVATHEETQAMFAPVESNTLNHHGSDGSSRSNRRGIEDQPADTFPTIYLVDEEQQPSLRQLITRCGQQKEGYTHKVMLQKLMNPKKLVLFKNIEYVLEKLNSLAQKMPNFKEVILDVQAQVVLQGRIGQALVCQPMILVGNPGTGKSHFVSELAVALGLPLFEKSFENVTTGAALSGTSSKWINGAPGAVVQRMSDSDTANFLFFIDEIEKAVKDERYPSPLNVLHSLWESETARKFHDDFLELPINTAYINWIAAANSLNRIPASILSRATVYHIALPTTEQMHRMIDGFYASYRAEYRVEHCTPAKLNDEVVRALAKESPRDAKKRLGLALARAFLANSQYAEIKLHHLPLLYGNVSQTEDECVSITGLLH